MAWPVLRRDEAVARRTSRLLAFAARSLHGCCQKAVSLGAGDVEHFWTSGWIHDGSSQKSRRRLFEGATTFQAFPVARLDRAISRPATSTGCATLPPAGLSKRHSGQTPSSASFERERSEWKRDYEELDRKHAEARASLGEPGSDGWWDKVVLEDYDPRRIGWLDERVCTDCRAAVLLPAKRFGLDAGMEAPTEEFSRLESSTTLPVNHSPNSN